MKKRSSVILPLLALIFLAIFLYVNNNKNKENRTIAPTPTTKSSLTQSPMPTVSPSAQNTPQNSPEKAAEVNKTENVKDFGLTVSIPEQWAKNPQYDNRFEGSTGFAEFTAISGYGLSLKEALDTPINSESKPLGDNPQINTSSISSQEAAIITPSGNSDPKAQCAIVVKFPQPVSISGTPYYYLLVWADRSHIQNIADTIKFVK